MNKQEISAKLHKALTIIGWAMCIILVPMLIINCTLIAKSFINKDDAPDFAGVIPLIVLTDSMYPDIQSGDLIFSKTADADDIEVGDTISFTDPAGNGTSIVTHQVIEIYQEEGITYFRTKGVNNNTADRLAVPADKLVGEYTGVRLAGVGNVALYMQTLPGLIIFVVVPFLLFVGYDVIRRRMYEKQNETDVDALKAELEALRAEKAKAAASQSEENPEPVQAEETV